VAFFKFLAATFYTQGVFELDIFYSTEKFGLMLYAYHTIAWYIANSLTSLTRHIFMQACITSYCNHDVALLVTQNLKLHDVSMQYIARY